MAKKFLTSLGLVSLASDPVSGTEGELYYNNVSDGVRLYKNGAWTDLSSTGALPSGGATGQILAKSSNTDYAVEWIENYADYTEVVKLKVKNDGTRALYKGQPVYVTGSDGTNVLVGRSSNVTEGGSSKTIGLLEQNLATNGQGYVIKEGKLGTLDTSTAGAVGDPVWLGVDGELIYGLANKPYAPAHLVYLGVVTKKNGSTGEIFVQVQNGFELQELHNVGIGYSASIQNDQALVYNSSASVWNNADIVNSLYGTGNQIDVSSNNGDITLSLPNDLTTPGNLTVTGNLTVSGSTTYINTETLNIEDNIITLNSNVTGSPTGTAGIEIERGTSPNSYVLWDESLQAWSFSDDLYTHAIRNQDIVEINVSASAGASGEIDLITNFAELNINSDGSIDLRPGNVSGLNMYKFAKTYLQFPDSTQQGTAFLGMANYDTNNLDEGTTNLYFTSQRAIDALASTLSSYLTNSSASTIYQPLDSDLTALAGLTSASDALPYFTGSGTASTTTLTTFGRSLIDDADAATARTTLGLTIGTNVQGYDAELAALAGLTSASDALPYFTGSGTASTTTLTTFGRSLIDDADAATARTTLGLGTMATAATSSYAALAASNTFTAGGHSMTAQSATIVPLTLRGSVSQTGDLQRWNNNSGTSLAKVDASGNITAASFVKTSGTSSQFLKADGSVDSSTYLDTSSASGTYLTQVSASTTYQPLDTDLTAIAGLTSAADRLPYFTGSGTASLATFTTFGRSLVDDADANAARTTLGLGTIATAAASDYLLTSSASGTYLTQVSASTTYAKLSGAAFTGDISTTGVLKSIASAANEGGQVELSVPSSGTTLSGTNVTIDVYQDKLRIFESGGTNRGVYIPLTSAAATVGTSLLGGTTGAMNYAQTAATKQSGVSSAGTTLVSVSITTNGYPIQVIATGDMENNSAGGWVTLQLYRGSTAVGNIVHAESSAGSENVPFALNTIDTPAAGTYTYSLKMNTSAGGTFNFGESNGPVITAVELSGPKGDTGATGAAGSSPNSFTTISVSGQSDVVADSSTDTLTLTAGTGITLTTNATTDAVTIGVTSSTYQPLDADLTAIAGLTSAADRLPYFTGSGTASLATFTTFGRSLVDDADAETARTTLGLTIGTNVQPYDAELAAIAGLTSAADRLPYFTGSGTADLATFTAFGRSLVDDADANAARTTLGLGTMATAATSDYAALSGATFTGDIAVNGGDITTTSTTATLYNSNATTIDIGGSASAISIGSTAHTGTTTINNNLSVYGSITFSQGSSSLSSTTIQIDDTLISLSDNNTADILDIGLFAGYRSASVDYHTGLVRDASDSGIWKLFSGVSAQPTDTVDFTSALYDILKVKSLQVTDAATTRTNLGLGTAATRPSTDFALLGSANAFTVGGHTITSDSTTSVNLTIKSASSQTSFLQEWHNSAGSTQFAVGPSGQVRVSNSGTIGALGGGGSQIRFLNNAITITTNSSANPGLHIQGAASQVGALQEWQDSGGSPLASVSSSGNITAASFIKTSGTSSQFLKADGSVDSSTYLTTGSASTTYQPLDSELTALAGLTSAADRLPYFTGSGTASLATFTTFGRSLVDDADATAARTTLGLIIGTNVQAWDQDLTDIAALTANGILRRTAGVWAMDSATYLTSAVTSITAGTGLSGGTITSTGTIALATAYGDTTNPYASKTANYVLASPNGTAGVPTFRALLAADIPTLNQNTTGSAATLTTPRAIYGNNFDGSAALTQVISATYGGTGNGFTAFSGPATSTKTFTLPNATATILTDNSAVTLTQGGTNASLTASNGGIVYSTATAMAILAGTATAGQILRSGASGAPSWSTATFPSTATTSGTFLRADGTNWVASTQTLTLSGNTTIGSTTNTVALATSGNTSITLPTSGTLAILGNNTFTGSQTLRAGTATAGTAPLYFTSGTNLTAAAAGAMEFDGTNLYFSPSTTRRTFAFLDSPTFTGTVTAALLDLTTAATATTATSYFVETGSDGVVRPKTLADVRTEVVTTAAVNSASATTVGTVTSGTWSAGTIATSSGGTGLTTIGTAGQVLKVNAGGTALEWGTASGGSSFTNSSELAALLSDETGSGSAVFSSSPTFTGTVTIPNLSIGGQALMQGSTGITSATSSFDTTVYSSAEFIVYGSTSAGNYVSKVLMLARGTATPVITEYAILTQGTAPTVTITPSYSAPNAVLTVAVTSGTNIEIIATEVSI